MKIDIKKYKRLWPYLKPYWRPQVLLLLVMMVLTVLTLALPGAIQYMIDKLIPNLISAADHTVDYAKVLWFGAFLLGIYLFEMLFAWARDYLAAYIGISIIRDMRVQLFSHLQRLSLRFFGKHQTGEMMSRILSDVGRLQDLLTNTLLMLFTNILLLLGILGYLLYTNWLLTLIAVIPVPLTAYASNRTGRRLNSLMTTVQEKMAQLSARLQESLMGIRTIKAFGQESRVDKQIEDVHNEINPLAVKVSVTTSLGVNLVQFINMTGPIVVLAWGVYLVATGGMLLGELIAFYILLTYLHSPIRGLAETNMQIQSAMASATRIFEYLDTQPETTESATPVTVTEVRGEYRLDNVGFAYAADKFRIDNLSLTIHAREKVALVGASGSGKTTIINLLMRFFDPESGAVLLDGVDLKDLSHESLRSHVALVEQDPLLFRTSVRDNIAYGYPDATQDEIEAATKAANIHNFISGLPEGYDTEVGERGVTVSGGERQRLCLARAILKNPSVLILDEATSALDSNSEQLIQEALKDICADKTAIIIAHRLATIRNVDRIIAIDNGQIIDQGTHGELLNRCSLYRELAEKQMLA